ncbi:MAG: hypothetical protein ABIA78_02625, partial [archaeon]
NMADGFGSQLSFWIQDSASGPNRIASIIGIRDSADTEGALLLRAGTNGTEEFMRIDHNGNIGIGTTSPEGRLHVIDSAAPFKFERTTATTNSYVSFGNFLAKTSGDMADGFGGGNIFYIKDTAGVENPIGVMKVIRDGADNSGKMVFTTVNAGSGGDNLVIDKSGNVGIGTTSPTAKLEVNGEIKISDTSTGSSSGASLCIGSDNKICKCGQCM